MPLLTEDHLNEIKATLMARSPSTEYEVDFNLFMEIIDQAKKAVMILKFLEVANERPSVNARPVFQAVRHYPAKSGYTDFTYP